MLMSDGKRKNKNIKKHEKNRKNIRGRKACLGQLGHSPDWPVARASTGQN